jgi:Mn-dependent DtxR family transcriptional regulator
MGKTQKRLNGVLDTLAENRGTPGVRTSTLRKKLKMTPNRLSDMVWRLRDEGHEIYTNYRKVDGKRVAFYRLAN